MRSGLRALRRGYRSVRMADRRVRDTRVQRRAQISFPHRRLRVLYRTRSLDPRKIAIRLRRKTSDHAIRVRQEQVRRERRHFHRIRHRSEKTDGIFRGTVYDPFRRSRMERKTRAENARNKPEHRLFVHAHRSAERQKKEKIKTADKNCPLLKGSSSFFTLYYRKNLWSRRRWVFCRRRCCPFYGLEVRRRDRARPRSGSPCRFVL